MRSVMLLFKRKREASRKKKFALTGKSLTKALIGMIEKEDVQEAYTMEKSLIIEAWSKYRPHS